ncbi:MAG: flagellar hook assembly protein FlgD [Hyphomicrobiales bacterium]
MEITSTSALANLGQAAQSNATIADDFDSFLSLLTTQLQNQNPLEPLDTNEFTAQLVQFTSVEQSIATNKNLEQLVALSVTNAFQSAVGYIGKTVTAAGSVTQLSGGQAVWNYNLTADAPETTITIRDSTGQTVFTETRPASAGANTFTWNGQLENGTQAPDGAYSISVQAKDASGNNVGATTETEGVVTAVDLTGTEPILTINGSEITLSSVKSVKA